MIPKFLVKIQKDLLLKNQIKREQKNKRLIKKINRTREIRNNKPLFDARSAFPMFFPLSKEEKELKKYFPDK